RGETVNWISTVGDGRSRRGGANVVAGRVPAERLIAERQAVAVIIVGDRLARVVAEPVGLVVAPAIAGEGCVCQGGAGVAGAVGVECGVGCKGAARSGGVLVGGDGLALSRDDQPSGAVVLKIGPTGIGV